MASWQFKHYMVLTWFALQFCTTALALTCAPLEHVDASIETPYRQSGASRFNIISLSEFEVHKSLHRTFQRIELTANASGRVFADWTYLSVAELEKAVYSDAHLEVTCEGISTPVYLGAHHHPEDHTQSSRRGFNLQLPESYLYLQHNITVFYNKDGVVHLVVSHGAAEQLQAGFQSSKAVAKYNVEWIRTSLPSAVNEDTAEISSWEGRRIRTSDWVAGALLLCASIITSLSQLNPKHGRGLTDNPQKPQDTSSPPHFGAKRRQILCAAFGAGLHVALALCGVVTMLDVNQCFHVQRDTMLLVGAVWLSLSAVLASYIAYHLLALLGGGGWWRLAGLMSLVLCGGPLTVLLCHTVTAALSLHTAVLPLGSTTAISAILWILWILPLHTLGSYLAARVPLKLPTLQRLSVTATSSNFSFAAHLAQHSVDSRSVDLRVRAVRRSFTRVRGLTWLGGRWLLVAVPAGFVLRWYMPLVFHHLLGYDDIPGIGSSAMVSCFTYLAAVCGSSMVVLSLSSRQGVAVLWETMIMGTLCGMLASGCGIIRAIPHQDASMLQYYFLAVCGWTTVVLGGIFTGAACMLCGCVTLLQRFVHRGPQADGCLSPAAVQMSTML